MHAIRLRGPWQIVRLDGLDLGVPVETAVPGDWSDALGANFRGRACYSRRFGLPTNLSPQERVFLVVERVLGQATIELNDQSLGAHTTAEGPLKYEVTPLLQLRNSLRIVIEVAADQDGPGELGEVRLEIE